MKGIVIKPTTCCGNISDLGKVYEFSGECEMRPFWNAICVHCGNKSHKPHDYYETNSFVPGYTFPRVVHKSRVKFFDNNLDKEIEMESNEDLIEEKEKL